MVSTRLLVLVAYLLQPPGYANSGHAKSIRAQLIDDGIIKLKNTYIIVSKEQPLTDSAKDTFFKQFDDSLDYHSEGLGHRRMDVHFSTYLSGQRMLSNFRPIRFDQVVENAGDCYKTATGIFEAPVAGRYSFTIYCLHDYEGLNAHLVVDGHRTRAEHSYWSRGRKSETYNIRIHKDSAVWVEPVGAAVIEDDRTFAFSGKLVYAL